MRKAGSVLGIVQKQLEMIKHKTKNIMENGQQHSISSQRLLQNHCNTDCYSRSFLPTVITIYKNFEKTRIVWVTTFNFLLGLTVILTLTKYLKCVFLKSETAHWVSIFPFSFFLLSKSWCCEAVERVSRTDTEGGRNRDFHWDKGGCHHCSPCIASPQWFAPAVDSRCLSAVVRRSPSSTHPHACPHIHTLQQSDGEPPLFVLGFLVDGFIVTVGADGWAKRQEVEALEEVRQLPDCPWCGVVSRVEVGNSSWVYFLFHLHIRCFSCLCLAWVFLSLCVQTGGVSGLSVLLSEGGLTIASPRGHNPDVNFELRSTVKSWNQLTCWNCWIL